MTLDGVQESNPLAHDFLVFDRDHLVEVNGVSFLFQLLGLVVEPRLARPKWLHLVPRTKLVIQNFQFFFDLGVIVTRPWTGPGILGNTFDDIPLGLVHKGSGVQVFRVAQARPYFAEDLISLLILFLVALVLLRGRIELGSGVDVRLISNVSVNQ